MRHVRLAFLLLALSVAATSAMHAQAENVPATHPVYTFLKKMAVCGLIERYTETILPLSRREVASFLATIRSRRAEISEAEQGRLDDFCSEFQYELAGDTKGFARLIDPDDSSAVGGVSGMFSNREKYLYFHNDSLATMFVNGLVDIDARGIHGDDLGRQHAEYLQLGGRIHGTLWGKLGYWLQLTNAGYRGSRDLLQRDPILSQSHELYVSNARNFDFGEGYVRYDGGMFSAEVGRERVVWGSGYDQKLTASDNVPVYDFVRAELKYKAIRYSYMHAWLSGQVKDVAFSLPFDTSAVFYEPTAADKYLAVHRFELLFPRVLDFGFQEMVIYSNRSPDLAYLNPVTIYEVAQRARGDRDNMFWLFDVRTHFIPGIEFMASILYDDINLPDMFSNKWSDRYGWQVGMFYADALGLPNTTFVTEYTRIEPYVFSHGRSREDSYTSLGRLLGTSIGPNADMLVLRADYAPARNLAFDTRVSFMRKGWNITDSTGQLIRNVGGDVFAPHRDTDAATKSFLDGLLMKYRTVELSASWEFVNQWWLEGRMVFESAEVPATGARCENTTGVAHVRVEF